MRSPPTMPGKSPAKEQLKDENYSLRMQLEKLQVGMIPPWAWSFRPSTSFSPTGPVFCSRKARHADCAPGDQARELLRAPQAGGRVVQERRSGSLPLEV